MQKIITPLPTTTVTITLLQPTIQTSLQTATITSPTSTSPQTTTTIMSTILRSFLIEQDFATLLVLCVDIAISKNGVVRIPFIVI
jgi:hypothetical protein